MPVLATHLTTAGSTTDATSFNTASITATAGKLVLLAIGASKGSGAGLAPTLSGGSMSFSQVRSAVFGTDYRLSLFRAVGQGIAGAITIDFSGVTQTGCLWSISEFINTKTTGTNGADGIVQSAEQLANSGATGFNVTLGAFSNVNNATYGCVYKNATNNVSVGSGFTELGEASIATPNSSIQSEWKNTNDTSVDGTFDGSGGDAMGAFGVELAFSSPSGFFMAAQ